MPSSGYIPALDGLRTVAILLVLTFHVNEAYLPGGFVGVDIFFVISGYIISRNILSEQSKGRFSFLEFYHRRVARLLPALLATVVVSLFAATIIYPADTVSSFARVGIYSVISLANVFFYFNSGYFDEDAKTNIFLHMWSLSVEEQFYLVWPLLLIGILWLRGSPKLVLWAILLLSFVGSCVFDLYDPTGAFFLMPARVFQFAAGALLAAYHLEWEVGLTNIPGISTRLLGLAGPIFLAGLALVLAAALLADGEVYSFWVAAALPALGTSLVIFGIASPIALRTLGNLPARRMGKRAYSVYLVHWPLIVMGGVYFGVVRPIYVDLGLFFGSFVLGEILYRAVEQPFRLGKVNTRANQYRTAGVFVLSLATMVVLAHLWAANPTAMASVTPRQGPVSYKDFVNSQKDLRAQLGRYAEGCTIGLQATIDDFKADKCVKSDGKPKILIIGDSFAGEINIMLSQIFPPESLLVTGTAGCAPMYPEPIKNRPVGCSEMNKRRFDWVNRTDIKTVAIITNWNWLPTNQIKSMLAYLKSKGKFIIVFGTRPIFTTSIPTLADSVAGPIVATDLTSYLKYDFNERRTQVKEIIKPFSDSFFYFDLADFMCQGKCTGYLPSGTPIYIDAAHMTANAAIEIGEEANVKFGAILRQKSGVVPQAPQKAARAFSLNADSD